MINKKAQAGIISFAVVIVGILIIAPVVLKLGNTMLGSFSTAINSTSELASTEVTAIQTHLINFWDYIIGIAFLVNVIMLFVFAFMVDSHPVYSLFYFLSAIFLLMFAPYFLSPVEAILGMSEFSTEVLQLPITGFIVTNFTLILLAIIIVTGIIMYGKFRSNGGGLQQ